MSGQKLENREKGVEKFRSRNVESRTVHESRKLPTVVQEALTLEYYEREIERARAQFESKLFTVQC